MIRRRPEAFYLPSQCAGHDGLEQQLAEARAALSEALGLFRWRGDLGGYTATMPVSVHERLSEIATKGDGS